MFELAELAVLTPPHIDSNVDPGIINPSHY